MRNGFVISGVLLVAGTVAASPIDHTILEVAPRVGVLTSTSDFAPQLVGGVAIDYLTPALDHQLAIGIDASFALARDDSSGRELAVATLVTYRLRPTTFAYDRGDADLPVIPWVAAGLAYQRIRAANEHVTEVGLALGAGVDHRLGPGYIGADLRATVSGASELALGLSYRLHWP
jgi:hypothetical protein